MDLMFDEDVDEVGSDIEAYCPKCRADTTHVVITKYEDEIRRVQCNPCGDVHSFRKPRGELDEEPPEPLAVRRRQLLKKPTWEEFFSDAQPPPVAYSFRETYSESDIVDHPKFGVGFVSEILSDDKVELTFRDERRILVHNRKDLPEAQLILAKRKAASAQGAAGRRAAIAASPRTVLPVAAPASGKAAKGAGRGVRGKPGQAKAVIAPVAPAKGAPTKTAPVKAPPAKGAPVKAAPVKVPPTKGAPVKAAPVKAAPVKAAPVKAAKPVKAPAPQKPAKTLAPKKPVKAPASKKPIKAPASKKPIKAPAPKKPARKGR